MTPRTLTLVKERERTKGWRMEIYGRKRERPEKKNKETKKRERET